ncbi:YARHG domain-containing protein [Slackia piriformis]|uniref:YARHG domain-containing protein n=1 Tax=Slackia piriformis TaxID=626934 RepID=UPI0032C04ECE
MEQHDKTSQGTNGYCTACGSPLEEGVSFCTKCGNPVAGKDADASLEPSDGVVASSDAVEATTPVHAVTAVDSAGTATSSHYETVMVDVESDMTREAQNDREAAARATESLYGVESVESAFAPGGGAPAVADAPMKQTSTVSKKPLFIGIGVAVVLLAIVIILVVLVFGKAGSTPTSDEGAAQDSAPAVQQPESTEGSAEEEKDEEATSEPVVVNLTDSYTTRFSEVNEITYPAFTFQYPGSGWAVVDESVAASGEHVSVENVRNGAEVSYQHWGSYPSGSAVAELVDVERVADSSFVPSYVQANDHSDLGSFGVVRATLRVDGVDNGTVYAVIPDAALKNPSYMDMGSGLPAFDYSSWISFTCMTSEELDKQTEQEVIAILASFKVAEASDNASASKKSGEGSLSDPDGYVLSDSSSRTYSNAELEAMSDYELYLARNEVFARHGRIFKNSDLQEYFGSKSWYDPRYTPEEFSESMLNANEKANIERMAKIEQDRNSPYID